MNRVHRWYCQSSFWKRKLDTEILPWTLNELHLGDEVLEVGPGPGLTTDWLRDRCPSLTCLEIDPALARNLCKRAGNASLKVQIGDATRMPFEDRHFSAVLAFTMLHHIASPELQNRAFAEAYRVLQPGGVFAGVDSTMSLRMRIFHIGDTMVTVEPADLPARLNAANFTDVRVETMKGRFRFRAHRPPEVAN
jgi:ubiquinone/menaquinone biosynthesis C-methylase UbiE